MMRSSLVASPLYSLSVLEFQESLCFSLSPYRYGTATNVTHDSRILT